MLRPVKFDIAVLNRSSHACPLACSLRRLAGVGAWSIVSRLPLQVNGILSPLTPCLSQLQLDALQQGSTILVLQRLAGEEEVPPGVVGVVVLGDCPDVLSHAAVRARNCRVPVVACPR
jgi:alpha-glucan,water dikinase